MFSPAFVDLSPLRYRPPVTRPGTSSLVANPHDSLGIPPSIDIDVCPVHVFSMSQRWVLIASLARQQNNDSAPSNPLALWQSNFDMSPTEWIDQISFGSL